jgi:hypothetical protein
MRGANLALPLQPEQKVTKQTPLLKPLAYFMEINTKSMQQFIAAASSAEFNEKILNSIEPEGDFAKVYAVLRYRGVEEELEVLHYYFEAVADKIIEDVKKFKSQSQIVGEINKLVDSYRRKEHFKELQKIPVYEMNNEIRGFQTCSVE